MSTSFKLLVVDDSQTVRVKVKRTLTQAGYEVITAADGYEALELLSLEPDLLVLDVNMPGLDGFSVCEQLQAMGPEFQKLPIVFLTSMNTKAMELLGREFGAYLHKPVAENDLLEAVQMQLVGSGHLLADSNHE